MSEARDANRSRQVELILQQVETLPTLSPIATRLLSISSVDDADLGEIVRLIESDPALTARILGLCRKASRGLGDRITTVGRAVVMLGLEAVQSAVLSVQVYELMDSAACEKEADDGAQSTPGAAAFDREGFWKQAVAVACCCDLIAQEHESLGIKPEEAFVAGLLHDLGTLVLDLVLPRSYGRVVAMAQRRRCNTSEIERAILGIDHYTAGKRLAEHWALPHALQDVMWLHGQRYGTLPDLPHKSVIGMVTVSRALCRSLHLGWYGDAGPVTPVADLCAETGLDVGRIQTVVPGLHEAVAERCEVLGLDAPTTPELLLQSIVNANRQLSRMNDVLAERSKTSCQQARVLSAISAFHAGGRPGRSVVDAFAAVVRSASELIGVGFYAVVFQSRPDDPWQMCQFSSEGQMLRCVVLDAPPGPGGAGQSLARLADPAQMSVATIGLLPWVADCLQDVTDVRRVRLLPLSSGRHEQAGPAAVLLHDRDLAEVSLNRSQIQALTATWSSAIASAAQHEGARRLGEQLAESNRSLAEAQGKLAESQAMARLGEMAAGAAHEMNNPLTIISGRSQMLAQRSGDAKDRDAAMAIAKAADDLSDLITSLHLLADAPEPTFRPVSIGQLVTDAAQGARGRTGSTEPVRVRIGEIDGPVVVDREMLTRAVLEVVANALEASDGRNVQVQVHTDPLDGRLLIVVTDQGTGMSDTALQHAFDPFFSEKPAGRQTGLGLTRARRLVELHDGEITLSSAPGRGAVAMISLPRMCASDPNLIHEEAA